MPSGRGAIQLLITEQSDGNDTSPLYACSECMGLYEEY
jgi:hypothetical protein